MRFVDEYRDPELARRLCAEIERASGAAGRPVRLMEVCGTHTMALFRHGVRSLMPESLRLLSGPGCPVCVTPTGELDAALDLAERDGVTVATFGDMLRVPGTNGSLLDARGRGRSVEIVYSPLDALAFARAHPDREVVFFAVGFETTAPGVAHTLRAAAEARLGNFSVYCIHKVVPPALRALLSAEDVRLDGLLLPGHVSTIIGARPYEFIPREFGVACVIAGFEPLDMLQAILSLCQMVAAGEARVEIAYRRCVRPEGNPAALEAIEGAFEPCSSQWRGLGTLEGSGLAIRNHLRAYDARAKFGVEVRQVPEPPGCLCGEVLRGVNDPADCAYFGTRCTPESPVGACMVSSEGTCAAHYRYGRAAA
jgi:hydrogenase expression/formation protein HypD